MDAGRALYEALVYGASRGERGSIVTPDDVPLALAHYWRTSRESIAAALPDTIFDRIASVLDAAPNDDVRIDALTLGEDQHVTFIVGAGASVPPPSAIPPVSKLLAELWDRATRIDQVALNRLRDWCRDNDIDNIEDLLTAAYIADLAATQPRLANLLEFFLFPQEDAEDSSARRRQLLGRRMNAAAVSQIHGTLSSLFSLLMGLMVGADPNPAHAAIATVAGRHRNTSIVTTNYDSCVDVALEDSKVPYTYGVENWPRATGADGVNLVKVHGSVNWSFLRCVPGRTRVQN